MNRNQLRETTARVIKRLLLHYYYLISEISPTDTQQAHLRLHQLIKERSVSSRPYGLHVPKYLTSQQHAFLKHLSVRCLLVFCWSFRMPAQMTPLLHQVTTFSPHISRRAVISSPPPRRDIGPLFHGLAEPRRTGQQRLITGRTVTFFAVPLPSRDTSPAIPSDPSRHYFCKADSER